MIIWNPWHGCLHCYMYFFDSRRGVDTSRVFRTENFDLPLQRMRRLRCVREEQDTD